MKQTIDVYLSIQTWTWFSCNNFDDNALIAIKLQLCTSPVISKCLWSSFMPSKLAPENMKTSLEYVEKSKWI